MKHSIPNLKEIFGRALEMESATERAEYLASVCADRPVLHEQIQSLLEAHAEAASFLESAAKVPADADTLTHQAGDSPLPPTASYTGPVEQIGAILAGRYKLIEPIGEGGMGVVYMAQQTEPVKRLVAVKVIKAGMDTRNVLARFEAERQALAMMDHPNIARVLDAGATDRGQPFFVMELVKGTPITEFCDARKLTPRQRLELFIPVCQAIQHAHQKGIIHRDVKPSNVLVALYDDHPVPKIIDFGVAKATGQQLTDLTLVTGFGAVIGTTNYMSPEQASFNQADIDTRSDIYSLGVLLYELLTGSTPLDRKRLGEAAYAEILRVIREVEPPRPSTKLSTSEALASIAANRGIEPARLTRQVRGELDWIIMKALDKDRSRRYETANGFALDVQRYLADEPVSAGPPSGLYRLRKIIRRNRGALSAAAVVAAALVIGLVGTTWQAIRAEREAGRASGEAKRADDEAIAAKANADAAAENARIAKRREREARRQSALMATNEGLRLADAGDVHGGLSWFVEAMARAPDDADIQSAGRTRFAAFNRCANSVRLDWAKQDSEWPIYIHFSQDGKRILTTSSYQKPGVTVRDATTGEQIGPRIEPTFDKARKISRSSIFMDHVRERVVFYNQNLPEHPVQVWDLKSGTCILDTQGIPGKLRLVGDRILAILPTGLQFLDITTGKPIGELTPVKQDRRSRNPIFASESGSMVAVVEPADQEDGRKVRLLNGTNLQPTSVEFQHPAPIEHMVFSTDCKQVAAASANGVVRVWDVSTGKMICAITVVPAGGVHTDATGGVAGSGFLKRIDFSPDGSRLFAAVSNGLQIFSLPSGRNAGEIAWEPSGLKDGTALYGALSPDGRWFVPCFINSSRVWDVANSGQAISAALNYGGRITWAAFSPDGGRLATAGEDKTVRVWDFDRIHSDVRVANLIWDRNTTHFASQNPESIFTASSDPRASYDGGTEQMRLTFWDPKSGRATATGLATTFKFFPAADRGYRRFVVDTDQGFQVFDRDTNRTIRPFVAADENRSGFLTKVLRQHLVEIDFTDRGNWIIAKSSDGFAQLCDGATGRPTAVPPVVNRFGRPLKLDFLVADDDQRVTIVSADNSIRVWDIRHGTPLSPSIHTLGAPEDVQFVDADKLSIVHRERRSDDRTSFGPAHVDLFDVASGKPVRPAIVAPVNAVGKLEIFANEHRALFQGPGQWNLFDLLSGQPIRTLDKAGEPFNLTDQVFNPHVVGTTVLLGGNGSFVLNLADGILKRLPIGNAQRRSEDGRRVLSGGRLWDTATWQPLTPGFPNQSIESISPDGRRVSCFTDSRNGVAREWEFLPTELPLEELQALCRVWSGRRFDADGNFVAMTPEELVQECDKAKAKYPSEFASLALAMSRAWHEEQAAEALDVSATFAAEFHLRILQQSEPADLADRYRLAGIHERLGWVYSKLDRRDDAVAQWRAAAKRLEEIRREAPTELPATHQLARIRANQADLLAKMNRPAELIAERQRARDLFQSLVAARPVNYDYIRKLAFARMNFGFALRAGKRSAEAEAEFRAAAESFAKVVAREEFVIAEKEREARQFKFKPPKTSGPVDADNLGWSLSQLGITLRDAERLPEAETEFDRAVEVRRAVVERDASNLVNRRNFAWTLNHAARTAFLRKNYEKATAMTREGEGHARAAYANAPKSKEERDVLVGNRWNALLIEANMGDHEQVPKCVGQYLEVAGTTSATAYEASCAMALAIPHIRKDGKLPEAKREELADQYTERAIGLLKQAIEKGWKDANWIRKDTDFNAIRDRADFKRVLEQLENKSSSLLPERGPPPRAIKNPDTSR